MPIYSDKLSTFILRHRPKSVGLRDPEVELLTREILGDPRTSLRLWDAPDGDPHQQAARASDFYVFWSEKVDLENQMLVLTPKIEAKECDASLVIYQTLEKMTHLLKTHLNIVAITIELPEKCLKDPLNSLRIIFETDRLEAIEKLQSASDR